MSTGILERTEVDRTGCAANLHGDRTAYRHGCICPDARAANCVYRSELRVANLAAGRLPRKSQAKLAKAAIGPGEINAANTRARLRMLAGYGYDWECLAALLPDGHTPESVGALAALPRGSGICPRVAVQVQALCNELVKAPAPHGEAACTALERADSRRWGIVDTVAVRRALHLAAYGLRVPLNTAERKAVVYTGVAFGVSDTVILAALGISWDELSRILAA